MARPLMTIVGETTESTERHDETTRKNTERSQPRNIPKTDDTELDQACPIESISAH
jgi:hypothetical protein